LYLLFVFLATNEIRSLSFHTIYSIYADKRSYNDVRARNIAGIPGENT